VKVWTKDPDEVADFTIDWGPELGTDTLASSTWLDITAGITTGTPVSTFTDTTSTIWIAGGVAGDLYSLTNRVTTSGGRTYDQEVELRATPTPITVPDFSGCVWPVDPACFTDVWDTYDEALRERSLALASATLYRLCGYRVGGCPLTARPVLQNGSCVLPELNVFYGAGGGFYPMNWGGHWSNSGWPTVDARLVDLPAPVGEVYEVKVDGAVVDEDDYTVIDGHYLAWVGTGDSPWPQSQDWITPDTESGTFSVTYLNAYPVDSLGAYAAGLLAMEFAKACATGGQKCKLPSNVVNIVRQGVSYEMAAGAFPDGRTTIREVDAYIEQWNPRGRRNAGMVFNPGRPKVHVQR
jgi:hypothetical protein